MVVALESGGWQWAVGIIVIRREELSKIVLGGGAWWVGNQQTRPEAVLAGTFHGYAWSGNLEPHHHHHHH